uniref:Uncharacterized protein n=1 Tax=Arundo donax TaxID=35708 RepID=A0A0A9A6L0_ARUDO
MQWMILARLRQRLAMLSAEQGFQLHMPATSSLRSLQVSAMACWTNARASSSVARISDMQQAMDDGASPRSDSALCVAQSLQNRKILEDSSTSLGYSMTTLLLLLVAVVEEGSCSMLMMISACCWCVMMVGRAWRRRRGPVEVTHPLARYSSKLSL